MEMPSGEKVETGILLKNFNLEKTFTQLTNSKFSGYLAIAIDNTTGIEEGILLWRDGKITGAQYEYGKFKLLNQGETAFQECVNALHAEKGVLDIFQLTKQQAELITAFNEKIKAEHDIKEIKKWLGKFSTQFNQEGQKKVPNTDKPKIDLMKKLGLLEIEK